MPSFYRNLGNAQFSLRGAERPGCLIFAEGDAEAFFLEVWLTRIGRDFRDIAVVCFKGQDKLEPLIKHFVTEENFPSITRFAFFLDAEKAGAAAPAGSITNWLVQYGVLPAGSNLRPGHLLSINGKRFALHVSPDNINPGFIEHTVMNEIDTTGLRSCIRAFEACLVVALGRPLNPRTLVQAFISSQRPRISSTGRGFDKGLLDVMHTAYDGIRNTIEPVL